MQQLKPSRALSKTSSFPTTRTRQPSSKETSTPQTRSLHLPSDRWGRGCVQEETLQQNRKAGKAAWLSAWQTLVASITAINKACQKPTLHLALNSLRCSNRRVTPTNTLKASPLDPLLNCLSSRAFQNPALAGWTRTPCPNGWTNLGGNRCRAPSSWNAPSDCERKANFNGDYSKIGFIKGWMEYCGDVTWQLCPSGYWTFGDYCYQSCPKGRAGDGRCKCTTSGARDQCPTGTHCSNLQCVDDGHCKLYTSCPEDHPVETAKMTSASSTSSSTLLKAHSLWWTYTRAKLLQQKCVSDECSPEGSMNIHSKCTDEFCFDYLPGGQLHDRCSPYSKHYLTARAECAASCGMMCAVPEKKKTESAPIPIPAEVPNSDATKNNYQLKRDWSAYSRCHGMMCWADGGNDAFDGWGNFKIGAQQAALPVQATCHSCILIGTMLDIMLTPFCGLVAGWGSRRLRCSCMGRCTIGPTAR